MSRSASFILALLFLTACSNNRKTETDDKPFFPAMSFIRSQVAHVDTSLYSIRKITFYDSTRIDTVFIHRDSFRAAASDFLNLPDLADKKFRKRFREETMFDETMNRVIFSYHPLDPEKEEIQSQEVLVSPNPGSGDKVTSIIVDRVISNRNGYLEKNLLWQVDQYFQVTTRLQKPGEPEQVTIVKVTWNEAEEE